MQRNKRTMAKTMLKLSMSVALSLAGGTGASGISVDRHEAVLPGQPGQTLRLASSDPQSIGGRTEGRGCGLPALDLSGMHLFDYQARWHASQWDNSGSQIPWRYDHVRQVGKVVALRLDASGAPQLQAVEGTPWETEGLWESDVTMPSLREGVVVAPLWLYNRTTKDEVDFEFVGRRGLDVSLHTWPGGKHLTKTVRLFAGRDFSGQRLCLGIKVNQGSGKIDMLLDGAPVYTWDRSKMDFFVSQPLRPFIEMWAANPSNEGLSMWTGTFTGFAPGEEMNMIVHGYRYTGEPGAAPRQP
jgi:hypothetical protein